MAENWVFSEINFRDVGGTCLGVLSGWGFWAFLCRRESRVHHREWLGG